MVEVVEEQLADVWGKWGGDLWRKLRNHFSQSGVLSTICPAKSSRNINKRTVNLAKEAEETGN